MAGEQQRHGHDEKEESLGQQQDKRLDVLGMTAGENAGHAKKEAGVEQRDHADRWQRGVVRPHHPKHIAERHQRIETAEHQAAQTLTTHVHEVIDEGHERIEQEEEVQEYEGTPEGGTCFPLPGFCTGFRGNCC